MNNLDRIPLNPEINPDGGDSRPGGLNRGGGIVRAESDGFLQRDKNSDQRHRINAAITNERVQQQGLAK